MIFYGNLFVTLFYSSILLFFILLCFIRIFFYLNPSKCIFEYFGHFLKISLYFTPSLHSKSNPLIGISIHPKSPYPPSISWNFPLHFPSRYPFPQTGELTKHLLSRQRYWTSVPCGFSSSSWTLSLLDYISGPLNLIDLNLLPRSHIYYHLLTSQTPGLTSLDLSRITIFFLTYWASWNSIFWTLASWLISLDLWTSLIWISYLWATEIRKFSFLSRNALFAGTRISIFINSCSSNFRPLRIMD